MESPRGGTCTESTHKVKTLDTAQEWFSGATDGDLPMTVLQWKTSDGRICAIFSNSNGERIGDRG